MGDADPTSLSLQELSDRLRIQDLLVEEAAAIDERDWDRWQAVYTEDARVDWSGNRGARGSPAEVRAWAERVLSTENFPYPQYQHTARTSGSACAATARARATCS